MKRPRTVHMPCGCTHDGRSWLSLCQMDRDTHDVLHAAAQREHSNASAPAPLPAQTMNEDPAHETL